MNSIIPAQIAHESETQRQYPRLSLPARVILNGKEYAVKNLSAGGIAVSGAEGSFAAGKRLSLDLKLLFAGFWLGVPLAAEVKHCDAAEGILGCRFVDQGQEQVSFLNHAIKSFIAGDIVTADNILSVARRNNHTQVRPHANNNRSAPSLRRQLPGLLLVLAIGVVVTALIVGNLYNSLFIVRADDATVTGPAIAVRTASEGVFTSRLDPGLSLVQKNQLIGTVTPLNGPPVAIQSPCNCFIAKTYAATGDIAPQGQQIVSLMPVDAKPWVIAAVGPQQAKKIGPDSQATFSIFGSRNTYTGHVTSMESPLSNPKAGEEKSVLMKIIPDQKLPVDFVNRLAAVTFAIH